MTPPPLYSLCTTLPPLHDVVYRQVGTVISERQLKRPRAGTGPPTDLPGRYHPTQVISDHEGKDEHSTRISGKM
jgi:hypothetical protein